MFDAMIITAIDFETTGKIPKGLRDLGHANFPRAVSVGAIQLTHRWQIITEFSAIILPEGFDIPEDATKVHGISTEMALSEGITFDRAFGVLDGLFETSDAVLSHNWEFDGQIYSSECWKRKRQMKLPGKQICTMKGGAQMMKIPGRYGDYKWPSLHDLYVFLFGKENDFYKRIFGERAIHLAKDDAWAAGVCGVKMIQSGDMII